MNLAYNYIKRNSVTKWTEEFLKDLKHAYNPIQATYYLGIDFAPAKIGGGRKNFNRLMQVRQDFRKLNNDTIYSSLLKSNKCVILIDIDALPHLKFQKSSIPTQEVIEQLRGLLIDNRNTVIIIGNQTTETLEEWFLNSNSGFGNHGNQFWLAAESGQYYKTGSKDKWQ